MRWFGHVEEGQGKYWIMDDEDGAARQEEKMKITEEAV